MRRRDFISLLGAAIVAGSITSASWSAAAQDLRSEIEAIIREYLAAHPDEVGEIAKEYLIKHPEAVGQILAEMLKRRPAATASVGASAAPGVSVKTAAERSAAIAENAQQLFSSPHQINLGNPDGDVTLVEFFDYNCGYCKRALPDMLNLLAVDPKLKIVLKEFPILGSGSVDAARVAVAVRMQDPGGQRYLPFHQALLGGTGPASKEGALALAKQQGLDMARLERDIASDEVGQTLNEDVKLAGALGITGTPSYVIGKDVVIGAVGIATLQGRIDMARAGGPH